MGVICTLIVFSKLNASALLGSVYWRHKYGEGLLLDAGLTGGYTWFDSDRHVIDQDSSGARILLENDPNTVKLPGNWIAIACIMTLLAILSPWSPWRSVTERHSSLHLSVDLGPDAVAGARTTVAISPDGTRIVHPVKAADGSVHLALRRLDQSKSTVLPGTQGGEDAFFSADGIWVGFSADGKLKKIPVEGGAAVTLCDAPLMRGGSWSEEGSIVFAVGLSNGLNLLSGSGGETRSITRLAPGEVTHRWPSFLPGGAGRFPIV